MDNDTNGGGVAIESTQLLACPFCGGKAYWCCCTGHKDSRCGRIRCEGCGLEALWTEGDCIEAKAKWNSRHANARLDRTGTAVEEDGHGQ